MDITNTAFPGNLLQILKHISQSHFVSIDLELSGVSAKTRNRGKQTLEERYQETRAAAERYQILQVGITCVEHVYDYTTREDSYVLRPYNFNISPLINERLDIERDFTFSSSAVNFLLGHGFAIDRPFYEGVEYLSRDEEKAAKKLADERLDRSQFEDLQLDPKQDVDSIAFVQETRQAIKRWITDKKKKDTALDITSRNPMAKKQPGVASLGAFERRLVHQLVRAEFPDFISVGKDGYVRISPLDPDREQGIKDSRRKEVRHRIARQTGFRWLVEALSSNGKFHRLDLEDLARHPVTGQPVTVDIHGMRHTFHRAEARLKQKRPVLVGHNCFTDMIYFYRTFIGALPPTLADFQCKLNDLFPFIVDTKYLVTHNCGDISPKSSLEETEREVRHQPLPHISVAPGFEAYTRRPSTDSLSNNEPEDPEPLHEAGYDAYLTARIMIRLSARLSALQSPPAQIPSSPTRTKPSMPAKPPPTTRAFTDSNLSQPHPQTAAEFLPVSARRNTRLSKPRAGSAAIPIISPITNNAILMPAKIPSPPPPMPMAAMPPYEDEFWMTYGNKMRVFGTKEGLCDLGSVPREVDKLGGGVALNGDGDGEDEEWRPEPTGEDEDGEDLEFARTMEGLKGGVGKVKIVW